MLKFLKNSFSFNLLAVLSYLPLFWITEIYCTGWTQLGMNLTYGSLIMVYYPAIVIICLILGINEFLILYTLKAMHINIKFSLEKFTNNKFHNIFLLGAALSFATVLIFAFKK